MLNRTVSSNRGLKRHALQGIEDLVPLCRQSLSWHARCLLFRRLTGDSNEKLQAKHILDTGNIVNSED